MTTLTTGEWAHDQIDAVALEFRGRFDAEGAIQHGGWSVEAFWRFETYHRWFGVLQDEVCRHVFWRIREQSTAVAVAEALVAHGLKAVIWRDGGGSESRREFRPADWYQKGSRGRRR